MRTVRVELSLAVMLGLVGSATAFLQAGMSVRPRHLVIPAHRFQAVMSRSHMQPRALRSMRLMSATVGADVDEVASVPPPLDDAEAPPVTLPEAGAEAEIEEKPLLDGDEEESASAGEDTAHVVDAAVSGIPLSDIIVGEEYEGIVTNVVSYGAFVDMGAEVNGLVHISQLSDEFISNCEAVVSEGDTVRVRVLSVTEADGKLVLSMRQKSRSQGVSDVQVQKYAEYYQEDPDKFYEATVDNIVSYGAFVNLEEDCAGFLHVSQMSVSGEHVSDPTDVLSIGDKVQVRIREVDPSLNRINLSCRAPEDDDVTPQRAPVRDVSQFASADPNEYRKGVVASIVSYGLFVKVDGVDGLLHLSKISDRSVDADNIASKFSQGQEMDVRIIDVDVARNKLSLSMLPPRPSLDLNRYKEYGPDEWLDGVVASVRGYGAFVTLNDEVDGMVHISQLDPHGLRVESVSERVQPGDPVRVRIIDVDEGERRIRLTMRESDDVVPASSENRRGGPTKNVERFLDYSPDDWISGKVVSITSFGAFVNVDEEADGLVHISQIADARIDNVEDVLSIGQEVQVRIIDVDVNAGRLGLSMRDGSYNRRSGGGRGSRNKRDVSSLLNVDPDEFIPGQVVSIVNYGAFVRVGDNVDGLLHISEMSTERVHSVEDILTIGQDVQVRVIEVNTDNNTVNLSMVLEDEKNKTKGGFNRFRGNGDRSGGGRGRDTSSFGREDFMDLDAADGGDAKADWQELLNNYFDEK